MSKSANYIFKNEIVEKQCALRSLIDNCPTSAVEKLKEAFLQYGEAMFDPDELANVFAQVDSISPCHKIEDNLNSLFKEDVFSYVISVKSPKGNKRPNIKIQVWKKNRRIFSGTIKSFVDRAEKLENTYAKFAVS